MIARSPLRCLCATLLAFVFTAVPASAQQFWQAPAGGNGTWTPGGLNWAALPVGPAIFAWNNGGTITANFGDAPGTVDINYPSDIFLNGINFSVSGYTINSTSGSLEFQGAGTTINTGANDATINAVIRDSGSAGFSKAGTGTLTLGGVNFHQSTRLNAGTLSISQDRNLGTNLGSPTVLFNGGTLLATSSFSIVNNRGITLLGGGGTISVASGQTLTYGGVIQGVGGALTRTGDGTLVLTGASTYTGVTTINAGILSTNNLANGGANSGIGASSSAAASLVINGGTLQYTGGGVSTDRLFTLGLNGGTIEANGGAALTLSNVGAIAFTGAGTRTLTLAGTNTNTNIFTPIIGDEGANPTSLVKNGGGIWRLNGANTYTGTTTVNGGTLRINGSLAAGSAVTVNSGATLRSDAAGNVNGTVLVNSGGILHGTGTVTGAVTMAGGSNLIGGNRSGSVGGQGTLTIGGGLTLADGATLGIRIFDFSTPAAAPGGSTIGTPPATTSNNFINVTAGGIVANPAGINFALDLTGMNFIHQLNYSYQIGTVAGVDLSTINITNQSQFSAIGLIAPSATYSVTGGAGGELFLNIAPVPEPATVLGLAAGALGAGGYIRRRVVRRA